MQNEKLLLSVIKEDGAKKANHPIIAYRDTKS